MLAAAQAAASDRLASLEAVHIEALALKDREIQSEQSTQQAERETLIAEHSAAVQDLERSAAARMSAELESMRSKLAAEHVSALADAKDELQRMQLQLAAQAAEHARELERVRQSRCAVYPG